MKILLDESVPRLVKSHLPHLDIRTVQEVGWAGIRNGELLRRAEEQFEVLITADQNLRYQQNLSGRQLAILVLPGNQVPIVAKLLPQIETMLATIKSGTLIEIPPPNV